MNTSIAETADIAVEPNEIGTWDLIVDGIKVGITSVTEEEAHDAIRTYRAALERTELVANVRALADWLEANPDAPCSHVFTGVWSHRTRPLDPVEVARAIAPCTVKVNHGELSLERHFGQVSYNVDFRDACEPTIDGRKVVWTPPADVLGAAAGEEA